MPDTLTEPLLTSLAHGGGCGCKLAPNVLADILREMPLAIGSSDLIVDAATSDDAAVYRVNETTALVATTDFFTPIVDDPHTFGRIAATNALSDVFAMGARPIFSLAASYQVEEEGVAHQVPMPEVAGPEGLENDEAARQKLVARLPEQYREAFLQDRPVEFRPVTPRDPISSQPEPPLREVWFKVVDSVDADPMTQRALLAYCSDFGLMGTAMLPHGMNFWQPHVQCASIDHAMWFHGDFRIDEWLLYRSESPFAGGSRGMNFGSIYRQDGTLVASVAQEGLMRLHRSDSPAA